MQNLRPVGFEARKGSKIKNTNWNKDIQENMSVLYPLSWKPSYMCIVKSKYNPSLKVIHVPETRGFCDCSSRAMCCSRGLWAEPASRSKAEAARYEGRWAPAMNGVVMGNPGCRPAIASRSPSCWPDATWWKTSTRHKCKQSRRWAASVWTQKKWKEHFKAPKKKKKKSQGTETVFLSKSIRVLDLYFGGPELASASSGLSLCLNGPFLKW